MSDDQLFFSLIRIEGYRGRNFTLRSLPRGKHSIFVMQGNTGKTTTIELLRWCFKYPQSRAKDKFRHMVTQPAHLLDWDFPKKEQRCTIEIHFSKSGHDYKFRRIVEGVYLLTKEKELGDNISQIEDAIEIDNGAEVYTGDAAHRILTELEITASADYFIFDGERAREYMRYASDRSKVQELIDAVDERVTPYSMTKYSQDLEELRGRIYDELGSKATDKGLARHFNRLRELDGCIAKAESDKRGFEDDIRTINRTAETLQDEVNQLNDDIADTRSENLNQITIINNDISNIKEKINHERSLIYKDFLKLVPHVSDQEVINKIKTGIRERGKLPEPYRKDLIKMCLDSMSCHICGKKLDEESKQRIKSLEKQIASHEVQAFLSSDTSYETLPFDSHKKHKEIDKLLQKLGSKEKELGRIQLSDKDKKLKTERDTKANLLIQHREHLGDLKGDLTACKKAISEFKVEQGELRKKTQLLGEYRVVLDEIDAAEKIIETTKKEIKKGTINVISNAISKSVKSILGPSFSARLTEDSLYLGENEVYHPEAGGMSGRLVLAYCFAESMTRVNPMIVDTPSGNIDDIQRKQLAEHLKVNHNQVILLCLPTETEHFASVLSPKTIKIQNMEGMKHA